jgi:glycerol-3-phosphate acyltransferase PlsY
MDIYVVNIVTAFACFIVGYFFGAIPNGVIIGKVFFHKDPRDYGSGNSGGTNTGRVFGKRIGFLCIALDMLKAVIPVYAAWAILTFTSLHGYYNQWGQDLTPLYYWLAGLGAAIGHCWPVYVHFKGGKAVACFMGLCTLTSWLGFLFGFFYLGTLAMKKMVSLASIIGGFFQVVLAWTLFLVNLGTGFDITFFMFTFALKGQSLTWGLWYAIVMTIIYVILVVRHHANIERIKEGKESKITWIK